MLSVFDLFKIGIGPSSSHTVGPMLAAQRFAAGLAQAGVIDHVARVQIELYGSLALTGAGHGTVEALLNGLEGQLPHSVDPATILPRARALIAGADLLLAGTHALPFAARSDCLLQRHLFLPRHPNGMKFAAHAADSSVLASDIYYSVGGGFIVSDAEFDQPRAGRSEPPLPFNNAAELLGHCRSHHLSIAQVMLANECHWQPEAAVRSQLLDIAAVMAGCVRRGCRSEGQLPGPFKVRRRAPGLYARMYELLEAGRNDVMLWPLVYALAVSEENASGGRVVTAPTNGAAGIVPAVLQYYCDFAPDANDNGVVDFLLTAAAIGMLYKQNASISGAEVGCQGEVGVACSMAAGAYCAVLGGSLAQVENAAEIAMEHHLGLTCDPVGGLVQVPCIERNGVAAEKAVKIAQLALLESGEHVVSLDQVIATMYRTGLDMQHSYKETSLAGLAVTIAMPDC
ncbi:L-serine dehydratase [Andreprevotia lacus DSM 23236]|jgi:L-serine dehydratase|uniref:L-serine dehydratase n=1 Tax=Andreprevotia lacus DSM 23236 TaxID=1121001 RepID=A0A1W1XBU3_9NEIS|nr:L-serine ammonia-lyase [Andreprevotia lacus]SMC21254.1 L-serine dehydratase [Andreprevotia lacus DSM 23236]